MRMDESCSRASRHGWADPPARRVARRLQAIAGASTMRQLSRPSTSETGSATANAPSGETGIRPSARSASSTGTCQR